MAQASAQKSSLTTAVPNDLEAFLCCRWSPSGLQSAYDVAQAVEGLPPADASYLHVVSLSVR